MKKMLTNLMSGFVFFAALSAHASVDSIAIGKILSEGRQEIAKTTSVFECLVKAVDQEPTCQKIEELNEGVNDFLDVQFSAMDFSSRCTGVYITTSKAYWFRRNYVERAKRLAELAAPNDPVRAEIQKLDSAFKSLYDEVGAIVKKTKLQEVYVDKCLLNQEPPSLSLKSQICG
jgi:response regulator RpfG family c-di-GMP phosphodiesterase